MIRRSGAPQEYEQATPEADDVEVKPRKRIEGKDEEGRKKGSDEKEC